MEAKLVTLSVRLLVLKKTAGGVEFIIHRLLIGGGFIGKKPTAGH